MCLINNSRLHNLTIPIIKIINTVTILNINRIIIKVLMSMLSLTSITLLIISPSTKIIMKDNINIPKMETKIMIINLIINNMSKHLSLECIREMRIFRSFSEKNNSNKFNANQLY